MTIKKYRVKLVLGDWSGDGHNISSSLFVSSSLSASELRTAYAEGTKKVGFDYCNTVCAEYEDSSISKEKLNRLKELGFELRDSDGEEFELEEQDECLFMDEETFAGMYMFICKLGNETLEYQFVSDNAQSNQIGGYGLYR